jgi:hypothetical protein
MMVFGARRRMTHDEFVVGTQVRLAGRASTLVKNRFLLTNMLRPDGTEVVLTTEADKFWDGRREDQSALTYRQTVTDPLSVNTLVRLSRRFSAVG